MLAGQPPIRNVMDRDILNWGLLESTGGLRGTGAGGARAVKHALSTALAPVPEERFATVDELAAALGGPGHRTSLPSRGPFVGRRGRRQRRLAVAGAGLVPVAALVGALQLPRRHAPCLRGGSSWR